MRHLTNSRTTLIVDPATTLGHGYLFLTPPPFTRWQIDRVVLSGSSPAKAQVSIGDPANVLLGTRAADGDAVGGLDQALEPGQPLIVYVFDGTVGATHSADAYGTDRG